MPKNGFTLTELVAIITIIAVLAAIAIPHVVGLSNLPSLTAADRLLAALQYAQTLAQRQGVATSVIVDAGIPPTKLKVSQDGGLTTVFFPNDRSDALYVGHYLIDFDTDVSATGTATPSTVTLTSVTYDSTGIPIPPSGGLYPACFTIQKGNLTYLIKVEPTGFSHSVATCP